MRQINSTMPTGYCNRTSTSRQHFINDSTSRREQMEDYSQVRVYYIQGFRAFFFSLSHDRNEEATVVAHYVLLSWYSIRN